MAEEDDQTKAELERLRNETKNLRERKFPNYDRQLVQGLYKMAPDWLLQYLIGLVETPSLLKLKTSFGITLLTGGALVTGKLISGREYLELFGKNFGSGLKMSEDDSARMFQTFADAFYPTDLPDDERNEKTFERSFIHMKDARTMFGAQQIPTTGGTLWRGRLVAVSGFILGELTVGTPPR